MLNLPFSLINFKDFMALAAIVRPLILVCGITFCSLLSAQEVRLTRAEGNCDQLIASLILTDIYKRAGLTLTVQPVPNARATMMATSGMVDGEVARIDTYAENNPPLQRVDPPYYYFTASAIAKSNRGIRINSKEDLKKYRVGIVRGILYLKQMTMGVENLEIANGHDNLYKMLEKDRVDVIIDTRINSRYFIKKFDLKEMELVGDLARFDNYNILTPANKNLAPKISATIKSLITSGDLVKLRKKYEEEFMASGIEP